MFPSTVLLNDQVFGHYPTVYEVPHQHLRTISEKLSDNELVY